MDASQVEALKATVATYEERRARFTREAEALDSKGQRIGNYRGVSFLAAVAASVGYASQGNTLFVVLTAICAIGFFALVKHHASVVEQEEQKRRYALVNEHGLFRTTNKWQTLAKAGTAFAPESHAYASDLDLFGNASLYQRISVAHTRYGQTTLVDWLSQPADETEIRLRQVAVKELASHSEFREQLQALGMALVEKGKGTDTKILTDGPNPSRLLAWAKTRESILESKLILGLSFLLPLLSIGAMLAQWLLGVPPYYWFVTLAVSLIVLNITKSATNEAFAAVSTTEGAFLHYGEILKLLETHETSSPWLVTRREQLLHSDGSKPSEVMDKFRSIVAWYDFRHSGMVYPFFNALLLWDVHCSAALQRWKRSSGNQLDQWFKIIGEFEALSSLAGFLADDPETNLPEIQTGPSLPLHISAKGLRHPLISNGKRVSNDFLPFSTGEALLVTGSNMSGKSTFLRALGVNCVLAFCGGPVIARSMSLPIVQLATSIRVSDSLSSGVSHFYAEVQKLALVVELARTQSRPVLFLLDEVLHGTNSRERQVGARWVLGELLKLGAFGVITTHDMELCRLPDHLMSHVRQHHFRELVNDNEMTFDYKLQDGPVHSGNALRLMRKVGLDVPLD